MLQAIVGEAQPVVIAKGRCWQGRLTTHALNLVRQIGTDTAVDDGAVHQGLEAGAGLLVQPDATFRLRLEGCSGEQQLIGRQHQEGADAPGHGKFRQGEAGVAAFPADAGDLSHRQRPTTVFSGMICSG